MTEEENEKAFRDTLRLIEEWGEQNKPPTLYDELMYWYQTHNAVQSSHDIVNEIVRVVRKWIPKEHPTNSYGYNKCIEMLNERLK